MACGLLGGAVGLALGTAAEADHNPGAGTCVISGGAPALDYSEAECTAAGGTWAAVPPTTTTAATTTTTLAPTTTTSTLPATTTSTLPATTTTHPPHPGYASTETDAQVVAATLGVALGVIVGGTVFAQTYRDDD